MVKSEIRSRRRRVAELRGENPRITVAALAKRLEVSQATIRRDLNAIALAPPVEIVEVAPSRALGDLISALYAAFIGAMREGDLVGMLSVASELRQAVKLSADQGGGGMERDAPVLNMVEQLLERRAA